MYKSNSDIRCSQKSGSQGKATAITVTIVFSLDLNSNVSEINILVILHQHAYRTLAQRPLLGWQFDKDKKKKKKKKLFTCI